MTNKKDKIAKQLARSYWRGRLESLRTSAFEDGVFERMIEEASEADHERWSQDAQQILYLANKPESQ